MNKTLLLDGAMGTELRNRGVNVPDYKSSVWSALAMLESPDVISEIHQDYIDAGSDVITVNNYAVTRKLLARENMDSQLAELTTKACEIAIQARDEKGKGTLIAGSLPPLDTSYRFDLVDGFEENLLAYREMANLLAPHVDIMLCETMSTVDEARAAATAAAETGKRVWVSWTLRPQGNGLRDQSSIEAAMDGVSHLPVEAFLFNCCAISPVTQTLPALRSMTDKPIGSYCNPTLNEPSGGEPDYGPESKLNADEYAQVAKEWASLGANIIGGCCGTKPEYIAKIKAELFQ